MASQRTRAPYGRPNGLYRQISHKGGGWLWRASVRWQQRQIDRHFYDATYGSEEEAKAMAEAWRNALIGLFTSMAKTNPRAGVVEHQLAIVNARFDALRPRWIFLRVYIVHLEGVPCQLRALVSDRGQAMQRREIGANFRSRPLDVALALMQERIGKVMVEFFGPEVAQGFMAAHGRAFKPAHFDPAVGIEIRERVDRYA